MSNFPNYTGRADVDNDCAEELEKAGIEVFRHGEWYRNQHPEMRTVVIGQLESWGFHRCWYYWVARGPGLPPKYANSLHETHGREVRVDGHCACPSPLEWHEGFAVGTYHVDTPAGLKALADALKQCIADATNKEEN